MQTIAGRVARGARWLDENYPTWWTKIDLSILDVASCHQCVLGQVCTGLIPADEQGQMLAQVISVTSGFERSAILATIEDGSWGGYNTVVEFHSLTGYSAHMGFATSTGWFDNGVPVSAFRELSMLTDEWTRVIIERRINANLAEVRALWAVNRAEVGALVTA